MSTATKINSAKLKELLKPGNLSGKILSFLEDKSSWILLSLFLIAAVFGCYVWYRYVYYNSWDEAKREEYINSKEKDVVFERKKFEQLISEKAKRDQRFVKELKDIPDIFRIKQ